MKALRILHRRQSTKTRVTDRKSAHMETSRVFWKQALFLTVTVEKIIHCR